MNVQNVKKVTLQRDDGKETWTLSRRSNNDGWMARSGNGELRWLPENVVRAGIGLWCEVVVSTDDVAVLRTDKFNPRTASDDLSGVWETHFTPKDERRREALTR